MPIITRSSGFPGLADILADGANIPDYLRHYHVVLFYPWGMKLFRSTTRSVMMVYPEGG